MVHQRIRFVDRGAVHRLLAAELTIALEVDLAQRLAVHGLEPQVPAIRLDPEGLRQTDQTQPTTRAITGIVASVPRIVVSVPRLIAPVPRLVAAATRVAPVARTIRTAVPIAVDLLVPA